MNEYTTTNSRLISEVMTLQGTQVNSEQAEMINNLQSMGLLEAPSYGLNCSPAACFQPPRK